MTAHTTSRSPARRSRLRAALAALLVGSGFAVSVAVAAPASAARSVAGPAGFTCGTRVISISPPRVWASYRTEQVIWTNEAERWDPNRRVWVNHRTFANYSTFNYYGQGLTYWSGVPPTPYGSFVNSRLHIAISVPGYYRIRSAVIGNQGGQRWFGYVANGGYCYVR